MSCRLSRCRSWKDGACWEERGGEAGDDHRGVFSSSGALSGGQHGLSCVSEIQIVLQRHTQPDLSCCKPTSAFLADVISRGPDKAVHTGVKRLNVHIKQQTLSLPSCQCTEEHHLDYLCNIYKQASQIASLIICSLLSDELSFCLLSNRYFMNVPAVWTPLGVAFTYSLTLALTLQQLEPRLLWAECCISGFIRNGSFLFFFFGGFWEGLHMNLFINGGEIDVCLDIHRWKALF